MVTLELTPIESELLRETLEACRQTLVAEIARADSRQYRTFLRDREAMVEELIARIAIRMPLHDEPRVEHARP
jgi:hypothetical protein